MPAPSPIAALQKMDKPAVPRPPTPGPALTSPGMPDYNQILAQKQAVIDQLTAKDRNSSPMTPWPVKALLEIISGGK